MKNLRNIIDHTLKNKHGKWSRKSLQMFVSFAMANLVGVYIVLSHHFADREISQYAIDVFFGLLAVSVGTSALTVWDKIKNRQSGTGATDAPIDSPKMDIPDNYR